MNEKLLRLLNTALLGGREVRIRHNNRLSAYRVDYIDEAEGWIRVVSFTGDGKKRATPQPSQVIRINEIHLAEPIGWEL